MIISREDRDRERERERARGMKWLKGGGERSIRGATSSSLMIVEVPFSGTAFNFYTASQASGPNRQSFATRCKNRIQHYYYHTIDRPGPSNPSSLLFPVQSPA